MLKVINVSDGFENYSQRNNKINPNVSCGPTNMIQALEYSGNTWDNSMYPELTQPEDKLTKFCRTNADVLEYYKTYFTKEYNEYIKEINELKKINQELYEVQPIKSYAPNEIHAVMNYATNLFCSSANGIMTSRVTHFSTIEEKDLIKELINGLPVVGTVRFNNSGHYVTIVGFTVDNRKYLQFKNKEEELAKYIKDYIIDNTYGRFNFKTNRYDYVSGNDEKIERSQFLKMLQPLNNDKIYAHLFTRGPATI